MGPVETVKERHGYLWWIMVASAWFERRIHQGNSEIKKVNSFKLNNLKKTGRCSEHVFQTKKIMKTHSLWLLAKESTDGKIMKAKCWLDCTRIAMFRVWKIPENLTKCSSLRYTQQIESEKKYKIRSSLNRTDFICPSRIFDIKKPLFPLRHTSIQQFSYRTFART